MLNGLVRIARDPARRALALEAAGLFPRAAWRVARAPFPRTVDFGAVPLGPAVPVAVPALSRLVETVAARMPFRALCFEQGLVIQRMLRRRGHDARLHYGVAPGATLAAHVWVSLDGQIVHGAEADRAYTEVGQWP